MLGSPKLYLILIILSLGDPNIRCMLYRVKQKTSCLIFALAITKFPPYAVPIYQLTYC